MIIERKMKNSLCKGTRRAKMMFAECYKITTFWTYPIFVSLVSMSTVSALNQSQSPFDANFVYDPTPDWSGCCDTDITGPSKVPGVDFLTYQVKPCDETKGESKTLLSSVPLVSSLPRLSQIEMCANVDGNFNLNFVLSLSLEDIIEGRLTDVQVTFGAMPGGGSNQRYSRPVCHQYSLALNHSLLPVTTAVENVDIPNSCLARDLDEGTFTLQVRPLPSLQHLDFRYQLLWAYFYDYSEVGIWNQLLLGVAPNPTANQIAVVFQPPKNEKLVDGFQLELFSFPEERVNSSVIPPSQTSFIFHHVRWGRYWVRVTPLSTLCQINKDACTSVSSPEVLMIDLEQPEGQPAERPEGIAVVMTENLARSEDGYAGLGRKLGLGVMAGAVVVFLVLATVLFALVIWLANRRRRKGHIPTLHMISPTLSPLEIKAVQQLAMALSNGLGIPVTLTWGNSTAHGGQSDNGQFVLTIRPDSDGTDCQETEEKSPCIQNFSHKDIVAFVSFSRSQDYFAINSGHDFNDFIQNPSLQNIVANISCKSYQKVIFILFTEQTQPAKLYYSVSEGSGRSNWDEIENDSDYQLTLPLRPSKSQTESDILSVCQPQRFCFQKLLSSCNTFCVPLKTQQLYSHLKARVFKLNPGHKFPPPDDIVNNEKWTAANTVAKIVLSGQKSFFEDAVSDFPGTCVTIDAVSLCNPKDSDMKSQHRLSSDEALQIFPPRDLIANNECFDFNTECDSFSNFSEMRRDLFS